MSSRRAAERAVAIVGVGAILPDAPDAPTFWDNVQRGIYSISEVPPERWDPRLYFDPDPKAPDKTYSKIGGWVRQFPWDPIGWRMPIPPRVIEAMDRTQRWALAGTREAFADYGYPERKLDRTRTAVILGNAMAGDKHYFTALRVLFPELVDELERADDFASLAREVREAIVAQARAGMRRRLPEVTEDTMPGELANVIAGRVAAVFDLHGPNYVCDAACASAMAAMNAAVEGLAEGDFDAVVTGGVDANMSASTYTKFCKIGALSATGTRPYAEGADGFVMGEGAAILLLKRLADAERDGDRIYAVIRGIAGSSDGKGRGITAPNPAGQKLAVERAWARAGLAPATATLIEGHGTSTRVGDAVEVETLGAVFGGLGLPPGRIALGSVKSNIGHLKGAAGAAGVLKTAFALRDKLLPPSLGYDRPNPAVDFSRTPFGVNTALRPWNDTADGVRRAGVSAFGFGGTNFHVVMEEHVPGRIAGERTVQGVVPADVGASGSGAVASAAPLGRAPLRGVALLAGANVDEVVEQLRAVAARAQAGAAPPRVAPCPELLRSPVRLAIDHGDAAELAVKTGKALRAFDSGNAGMWRALRAQGIFLGRGRPGKLAFLFTGQGSQYANMLRALSLHEPIVGETFAEADRVMTPLLGGRSLTSLVFVDAKDPSELKKAEEALRDTTITQPAVLAVDVALHRVRSAYGLRPDMVMGHSLGEYGALVASGALGFGAALVAVSARSAEMARVAVGEQGAMAAVFGPIGEIERVLASVDGYAGVANLNGPKQAVVGGTVAGIERAVAAFERAGLRSVPLSVSHAFHTKLVAQASEPLERVLAGLGLEPPRVPIISNVTGGFYPMAPDAVPQMIELLGK
ncbi:MAG: type I polyketide synthase, partial [Polyangiaceae bacterium]|nr:type I polyketide synthase [Polyangiaceae bacterium]